MSGPRRPNSSSPRAGAAKDASASSDGNARAAGSAARAAADARGTASAAADARAGLEPFRVRLDELDDAIARALGERFEVCRQIAAYKREHTIAMMQPDRVKQVRERYMARAAEVALPEDFTQDLFELLITATCRMEDELIDAAPAPSEPEETA